jgi:hypothetical protein
MISQANTGRQPSIRLIQNMNAIYGLSLYRYVESLTAMLHVALLMSCQMVKSYITRPTGRNTQHHRYFCRRVLLAFDCVCAAHQIIIKNKKVY